jgi:UrcA family protein
MGHAPQEYFVCGCRVRPLDHVCIHEAAKSIDSAAQPGAVASDDPDRCSNRSVRFLELQEIPMNTMTTSQSFRGLLTAAVLSAFACSLATVCSAAEPPNPLQTTVKYADLNVSKPEGAAALFARIQRAARQVCLPLDGERLSSKARMGACVNKAIADAVAKVGEPALFDAYNAHQGQPTPIILASTQSR